MEEIKQGSGPARPAPAGEGPWIRRGAQSRLPLKAAIIGGGKACDDLLALLSGERLRQLNMEILGVSDIHPEAPGIERARALGIFTTADFKELYALPGLNLIIELTGSTSVREEMIRTKPIGVSSIDHRGARLLWDLIQIETEKQFVQKEAEDAIRKERDWCQKVIDSLPDRIIILNRDYTIQSVNRTFEKETGLRLTDVAGKRCHEVSHRVALPCDGEALQCPLASVFEKGESCSVVHDHRDASGDVVYEEVMATPITDEKGRVVQVIEGIRDVTRRVVLERKLRESEETLRLFLDSAQDIICIKDLEGRYLYINPSGARAMGVEREKVIGRADADFFPENIARAMAERDRQVRMGGETLFLKEAMKIDGNTRHFHTVRFPILNDRKEIVSLAVIARDITEEENLQEQVRRNKEYMENILSNSSDLIITTDLDGRIVTFNPAGQRMLGYRPDEILGHSIYALWKDPEARRRLMEEVEREGAVNNFPAVLIAKDGHEVEVSLSLSRLLDARGRVLGTVGISKDMTEENRLRHQLIEQERLAAVGQTVAGVSHCMKNVLNGLKGGAYMVNVGLKRSDMALLEEGWSGVQKGIERIQRLSLDMLSYCKDRKPNAVPVDPLALARETAGLVAETARQDGIEVRCRGEEGVMAQLDPDAIGRALLNLITNALDACKEKGYGPGEKPLVDIEVRRNPGEVLFIIRDNGIGMGDEVKGRLFTRFFSTKEGKGTGLGLSVSKKAVEEHGGRIQVESVEGKGSTLVISLPDPDTGPSSRKTS